MNERHYYHQCRASAPWKIIFTVLLMVITTVIFISITTDLGPNLYKMKFESIEENNFFIAFFPVLLVISTILYIEGSGLYRKIVMYLSETKTLYEGDFEDIAFINKAINVNIYIQLLALTILSLIIYFDVKIENTQISIMYLIYILGAVATNSIRPESIIKRRFP